MLGCRILPSAEGGVTRLCRDYMDQFVSYEYKLPIQIICGFVFVPSQQRLSDLWQKFVCMLSKSFFVLEPGVPSHDITELGLGKPLDVSVGLLALHFCVFISAYPTFLLSFHTGSPS